MEEQESIFDPTKPLPRESTIVSSGSHFYQIGFSHYPYGSTKRIVICSKPIITNIILIILCIRCIISMTLPEQKPEFYMMIGDLCYFLNLRIKFNGCLIAFYLFGISCNAVQYWNYRHGIRPTYLRPFQLMAGFISPQRIGLTDKQ